MLTQFSKLSYKSAGFTTDAGCDLNEGAREPMEAERLRTVLDQLEREAAVIDPLLSSLVTVYGQVRDTPAQDFSPQLDDALTKLRAVLLSAESNSFPPSRRHIMDQLGASSIFGASALVAIDSAVQNSTAGPAGVIKRLEEIRRDLAKFRKAATSIRGGMEALGIAEDPIPPDAHEVGLIVPTELVHGELGELKDRLARWDTILRALSEVAGERDRPIQVRALATGDYEFFVLCGLATGTLLARILEWVVEFYKKVLEVQVLRQQLAASSLAPPVELKAYKEHEARAVKDGIDELAAALAKELPRGGARTAGESQSQLVFVITQIASYVNLGGSVEVTPPPRESDAAVTDDSIPAEATAEEQEAQLARQRQLHDSIESSRIAFEELRRRGASVASLPPRTQPVLQLAEPEEAPESGQEGDHHSVGSSKKKR